MAGHLAHASFPARGAGHWWGAILLTLVLVAACAAPPAAPAPSGQAQTQAAVQPRVARTLVVGSGRPVNNLSNMGVRDAEARDVVNASVTNKDLTTFQWYGWLAEDLPSLDKGTLRINADGTMTSTWKMRPNIKWHDGTPFDTRDLAFSVEIARDPNVPIEERTVPELIERMETPDSRTWVVHYKRVHLSGRSIHASYLGVVPRHILEPAYLTRDYTAFEAHPWWSTGFIGTGPYRVVEFRPAELLEVEAVNDYFLGRPKIDRISWRIITDRQVMLSNILTNAVDVTTRDALTFDGALVAREQWEATGQGKVLLAPYNGRAAGLSGLNPWFEDVRVRQALLHAIDREEIKETLYRGLIDVQHIPIVPTHPSYGAALAAATKYEFNAQRAQTLLQQAGWTRGSDGVLVNPRGERFSFEFQAASGSDEELLQHPIAGYWRTVGVETRINNMPLRTLNTEEYRNRWPGARMIATFPDPDNWENRYHSRNIPTEATRWVGENYSRWANPAVDKLLEDLFSANIRQPGRLQDFHVQFSRMFSQELPVHPIRYEVESTTFRTGLVNIYPKYGNPGENSRTWNLHLWEWKD